MRPVYRHGLMINPAGADWRSTLNILFLSATKRPFLIVVIGPISWLMNAYSSKTKLLMRSIPPIEPSCLLISS